MYLNMLFDQHQVGLFFREVLGMNFDERSSTLRIPESRLRRARLGGCSRTSFLAKDGFQVCNHCHLHECCYTSSYELEQKPRLNLFAL